MDVVKNRKIPALLVIALLGTMPCVPYLMSITETHRENATPMATNAVIEVLKTGASTTEDIAAAIAEIL